MNGSSVINFLLQSFYDQERGSGEDDVIYLKMSVATMDHNNPEESLREAAEIWVQSLASEEKGYTDFIDLVEDQLGPEFRSWLDNYGESPISFAIEGYVTQKSGNFSPHDRVQMPKRADFTQDLIMNVKYYMTRDDNRAYCIDRNKLRSLSGCMLHRLICPKQMWKRHNLRSAEVIKPKDKDILELTVTYKYDDNSCTFLILGDISNFTGSLVNSWLMLHCMARDISGTQLKTRKSLFSLGSRLISARWLDILGVYLYLTVGVPVWIEDDRRFDYLPGGYLGVSANITIGLLFLSMSMIYALRCASPYCYDIKGQAGGDDHAFLVSCPLDMREKVIQLLRYHMSNYVGSLKEFSVIDLDHMPEGIVPDATFCRKRIKLKRTATHMEIRGIDTFPIPVCILPTVFLPVKERQQAWTELDHAMLGYERRSCMTEPLCDVFRLAFLQRYPTVKPLRSFTKLVWMNVCELTYVRTVALTENAWKLLTTSFPVIGTSDHIALASDDSRLRHLLCSQTLIKKKVEVNGKEVEVAFAQSEPLSHLCSTIRWQEWRKPCQSESLLLDLLLK
jgi:hypothetical protein